MIMFRTLKIWKNALIRMPIRAMWCTSLPTRGNSAGTIRALRAYSSPKPSPVTSPARLMRPSHSCAAAASPAPRNGR